MTEDIQLPLRLLTITAHPHDVTYTLGTLAHHIERGDKVTVVSLSDGATTHNEELEDEMRKPAAERRPEVLERSRNEQASRKHHELQRVCSLFGIADTRVLPFSDNPIESSTQLMTDLIDIFYEVRPHIVITHAPYNYPHRNMYSLFNADHPQAGQIVQRAMHVVSQPDKRRERAIHHVAKSIISVSNLDGRTLICSSIFRTKLLCALRQKVFTKLRVIHLNFLERGLKHLRVTMAGLEAQVTPSHTSGKVHRPVPI